MSDFNLNLNTKYNKILTQFLKEEAEKLNNEQNKNLTEDGEKAKPKITPELLVKNIMVMQPAQVLTFIKQITNAKSGKEFISKNSPALVASIIKNGFYKAADLAKSIKDINKKNIEDNSNIDFENITVDENSIKTIYVFDGDSIKKLESFLKEYNKSLENTSKEAEESGKKLKDDVEKAKVKVSDETLDDNGLTVASVIKNPENKKDSPKELEKKIDNTVKLENELKADINKTKEHNKLVKDIKLDPKVIEQGKKLAKQDKLDDYIEKVSNETSNNDLDDYQKRHTEISKIEETVTKALKNKLGKDYQSSLNVKLYPTAEFKKMIQEANIAKLTLDAVKARYTLGVRIDFFGDESDTVIEKDEEPRYVTRLIKNDEKNPGIKKITDTFKSVIQSNLDTKYIEKKLYAYLKYWRGDNPDANFDSIFIFAGYTQFDESNDKPKNESLKSSINKTITKGSLFGSINSLNNKTKIVEAADTDTLDLNNFKDKKLAGIISSLQTQRETFEDHIKNADSIEDYNTYGKKGVNSLYNATKYIKDNYTIEDINNNPELKMLVKELDKFEEDLTDAIYNSEDYSDQPISIMNGQSSSPIPYFKTAGKHAENLLHDYYTEIHKDFDPSTVLDNADSKEVEAVFSQIAVAYKTQVETGVMSKETLVKILEDSDFYKSLDPETQEKMATAGISQFIKSMEDYSTDVEDVFKVNSVLTDQLSDLSDEDDPKEKINIIKNITRTLGGANLTNQERENSIDDLVDYLQKETKIRQLDKLKSDLISISNDDNGAEYELYSKAQSNGQGGWSAVNKNTKITTGMDQTTVDRDFYRPYTECDERKIMHEIDLLEKMNDNPNQFTEEEVLEQFNKVNRLVKPLQEWQADCINKMGGLAGFSDEQINNPATAYYWDVIDRVSERSNSVVHDTLKNLENDVYSTVNDYVEPENIPTAAPEEAKELIDNEETKKVTLGFLGTLGNGFKAFFRTIAVAKILKFVLNHGKTFTDIIGAQVVKFKEDKNIIAEVTCILDNGEDSDSNYSDTKFSVRFDLKDLKWHATNLDNRKMKISNEDALIKKIFEVPEVKEFKHECLETWGKLFDPNNTISQHFFYFVKNFDKLKFKNSDKNMKKYLESLIKISDNFDKIKKEFEG